MNEDRPIRNLVEGSLLRGDQILTADVCIVGSGPGGAVAAERFASAGANVVLLEEGGYHTRPEFKMDEAWSYPHLYQDHGTRATDDLSVVVLQGRALGGGTTVNWATCFRTPAETLAFWAEHKAVRGVTLEALAPHFDEIEARLSVTLVTDDEINANNRVLLDGARKLGFSVELLHRSVRNCMQTGMCGLGCPVNAKRTMDLTYLPDAAEKGARIFSDCRVKRLVTEKGVVARAEALALDRETGQPSGPKLTIRARRFIVSGGAINSPRLLQRSNLPDPHGLVGKRTWIHPVVPMAARFRDRIDPFYGPPQSVASHHFAHRAGRVGFFLETPPVQPMLAGQAMAGLGSGNRGRMRDLAHMSILLGLLIDGFQPEEAGGTVGARSDGRLSFNYPFSAPHHEAMREAMKTMARIQLAAGAEEVLSFHEPPIVIRRESDIPKLDDAPLGPNRNAVFTAHQMGGCPMGEDPSIAVVSSDLRHHHVENLYVMDGSVMPTSLGVNPQITIAAVASLAATKIAAKASP
jgi:choline dehydrogenase-like flavoprotein